ncbi:predicted protein [Nematostella vectensis]|uniref:G-protein coupled receptors family 1 profile domain-containing protein n=1 Tax=Nematostella vectensis TaxID=45351 RepID=A7RIH7_NEMVE|nr:predicted protein [Nematostella vectensis]|eukprot:XP_001640772.1 predicted protein [Nematostella vectensis]
MDANATGSALAPSSLCSRDLDLAFWILDGIIAIVILVGNSLTCAVFLLNTNLRQNFMNVFLLSLACSDLLMSVLVVPWFAAFCETKCVYPLVKWCWLFGLLRDIPFEGVILNLVAITYDRYLAVFQPLYYGAKMTKSRVVIILVLVWFLPVLTGLVRLSWLFTEMPDNRRKEIDRNLNIFLIFAFVLIPAIGIFVVNLMIMITIKSHKSRINPAVPSNGETSDSERQRERIKKRKGTMSCVLVVLVFITCWLPRIFYNFFYLAKRPDLASPIFIKVSMFFVIFQSTVNPFIYSFYRQEFRQYLLHLLHLN